MPWIDTDNGKVARGRDAGRGSIVDDPCWGTYHRADCGSPGWPCLSTVGYNDPALAWLHLRARHRARGGTVW